MEERADAADSPRHSPILRVAQVSTALLTVALVAAAFDLWARQLSAWQDIGGVLPIITRLTVAAPVWVNVITPILLGPVLLVFIRAILHGRDSLWLLAPVGLLVVYGALFTVGLSLPQLNVIMKPVIYLYPRTTQRVDVDLSLQGVVTEAIPSVDPLAPSWSVVAQPNGRLSAEGHEYPYLFWEAVMPLAPDMSHGFVVRSADLPAFLEESLADQGLSPSESREFAAFWLPRMKKSAYVLVRFEGPAYERVAKLAVSPRPDSVIRVFMVFRALDRPVTVAPQVLPPRPRRQGFVVVEWGGMQVR